MLLASLKTDPGDPAVTGVPVIDAFDVAGSLLLLVSLYRWWCGVLYRLGYQTYLIRLSDAYYTTVFRLFSNSQNIECRVPAF